MKRYSNDISMKMIRISAKDIFDSVEKIGIGNHLDLSIYDVSSDSDIKRYRVDCGEIGSFEVTKLQGDEEFDLKSHDWIYIEGPFYRYSSLSTNFSGYPNLTIDKAFDFLN